MVLGIFLFVYIVAFCRHIIMLCTIAYTSVSGDKGECMYEKTLSIDIDNASMLQHIDNNIATVVARLGGAVAKSSTASRQYMAIAVPDCYCKQMNDLMSDLVLDVLTISYKHYYLSQQLSVGDSLVARTLVNCMSIFDSTEDKRSITNVMSEDNLAIDGYYYFRMRSLRDRWRDVVQLINSNSEVVSDSDTMLQFISYMIEGVSRTGSLSVSVGEGNYLLFDKRDNILPNTNIPISGTSVYELAMVDVLLHNPKQLSIYTDNSIEAKQFVQLACQLYPSKVYKNS